MVVPHLVRFVNPNRADNPIPDISKSFSLLSQMLVSSEGAR
jgi:hypothetical protein